MQKIPSTVIPTAVNGKSIPFRPLHFTCNRGITMMIFIISGKVARGLGTLPWYYPKLIQDMQPTIYRTKINYGMLRLWRNSHQY